MSSFSSMHLGQIISNWTEQILSQDWSLYESKLQSWKNHLYSCLLDARDIILRIVHSRQNQPDNILSYVCLSVAVLGEYINQALKDIFLKRGLESPVRQSWRLINWADCGKPIVKIMERNGWCPNKLAHFDSKDLKSIGELWYYANLDPPKAHVKHHECTSEKCRLLQVDLRDYRSVHSVEGCDCAFQGPLAEVLAETVMTGSFPLITVSENPGSGKLRVDLQRRDTATQFVAISHVWADGHGNLLENALPQCVLREIHGYINKIPRKDQCTSMPFWMDTLCLS